MVPLRIPGFRWFMIGRVAGSPTVQMRTVAQGWLIYSMTGSALALGWVSAARALIMLLLSPFGGVLCDRLEKRSVMLVSRALLGINAIVVAILFYTGSLRTVHVAIASMVDGVAFSFMGPAMSSIVSDLTDRETLHNAVAVSAMFHNGMMLLGGVIAGFLIEAVGAGGVYLVMAALFLFACYTLTKVPPVRHGDGRRQAMLPEMLAGVRYLRLKPLLIILLLLSFCRQLFGMPYRDFLAAFAEVDLGLSASGLGLLTSATGLGALVSATLSASLGERPPKGALLLGSGVAIGISILLLMTSRGLPAAFFFVFVESSFSGLSMVMSSTLIQSHAAPEYRGRVSGVSMMLMGLSRLSSAPLGALIDRLGVPTVTGAMAVLLIVVYAAVAIVKPSLRRAN